MSRFLHYKRIPVLMIFFLGIFLAIGYNYIVKVYSLPEGIKYVPQDSSLIIYTDSIDSLWKNLVPHLQRFFNENAKEREEIKCESYAFQECFNKCIQRKHEISEFGHILQCVQRTLNEKEVPINSLNALQTYGIDPNQGMIFALDGNPSEGKCLFIVPVHQSGINCFSDFLSKVTMGKGTPDKDLVINNEKFKVTRFSLKTEGTNPLKSKNTYLFSLFPGNGSILLSTHKATLYKSISHSDSHLSYYRNNDILISGLRAVTHSLYSSASNVFVFWRPNNVPWLLNLTAGFHVIADRLSMRVRIAVDTGTSKLLRELAFLSDKGSSTIDNLHEDIGALLTFKDSSLPYYLKFMRKYGGSEISDKMKSFFAGLLVELEKIDTSHELTIALTGYREGLPDVIVGMQGSRSDLEKIVFNIQCKKRLERDREILSEAIKKLPKEKMHLIDDPLGEVLKRGLLKADERSFWSKYKIKKGKIEDARLEKADFIGNSEYIYKTDSFSCNYILPPVTEDDLEYRYRRDEEGQLYYKCEKWGRKEEMKVDEESLLSDRYRLCTKFRDGILWIATDGELLQRVFEKEGGLKNDVNYIRVKSILGDDSYKMRFYLNMDRITSEGLLSPESSVQETLKQYLLDFDEYPSIMVDVNPLKGRNEIWISGEFLREERHQ